MPRKSRSHFRNAFYHVMLRGNYKQNIFLAADDYHYFYKLMEKVVHQYGCRIHIFCLMTNHVHLVIETQSIPLWKIIQTMATSFSKRIHYKYHRTGHLFQGRYKAELVQNDRYLLELCYYIHLNPVKAKIADRLEDYRWSSHLSYAKKESLPWLTTEFISHLININNTFYSEFIENRKDRKNSITFFDFDSDGSLIIKDQICKKINNKETLDLSSLPVSKIAETVCEYMKIKFEDLPSPEQHKDLTLCRSLITYFAHYHGHYYLRYIAYLFARTPDNVSKTMHKKLMSSEAKNLIPLIILEFKNFI